jgi:predicted RNA binding protein YcfA (HicA-like mRNA interferase family)
MRLVNGGVSYLVKLLRENGWELHIINGSHHRMRKDGKEVVVPVHGAKDLKPGTLQRILKHTGLRK